MQIARLQSSVPLGVREGLTGAWPAGVFEECPVGPSPPLRVVFWLCPGPSVRAGDSEAGAGRCQSDRRPARPRGQDGPSLHALAVEVSTDTPQPPGLSSSRAVSLLLPRASPSRLRPPCAAVTTPQPDKAAGTTLRLPCLSRGVRGCAHGRHGPVSAERKPPVRTGTTPRARARAAGGGCCGCPGGNGRM